MYKIAFLSIIFVFLLALVHVPAFAVDQPGVTRPVTEPTTVVSKAADRMENAQNKIAEKTADKSAGLQERASKELTRRINSLNELLTRISEFKKISDAQKASLISQVQAQITSLTTLQAKIAADTDPTTLKTDVQSIIQSYRIYALFMPKIQIIGAADRVLNIADEMSSQAATLQTKIAADQSAGKNVSDLQSLLSDLNAKIADAKTQAQSAIDTVTPLTPDGFPGNKTQLQNARQMITTAVKDLDTARQDGRKIIVGLLKFGKISSSEGEKQNATVSVSPSPSTQK